MPEKHIQCPVCNGSHAIQLTDAQARAKEPILYVCPDLDRRYRLASFYIESRRSIYKSNNMTNQADALSAQLKAELGSTDFEVKLERWKNIDYPPLGLIDEYPEKIGQIVNTYCMGHSYPAVTACCCLAERILNRLVLRSRDYFKTHPDYRKIYRKDSFDDWGRMLELISDWELIPERAVELFRELAPIRHQSIHYNAGYDFDTAAPTALNKLIAAITEVFGVINRKDIYLVFDIPGEVWVRSDAESLPFVKEFVVPHCYRAHAFHDINSETGQITERVGKVGPLTDEEFVELRKLSRQQSSE